MVWSSPPRRQLHSSGKFERLLICNAVNGIFLTDLPAFIQIKLSVKVIKKTWLKCHCAVIKLIDGPQFTLKPLNDGGPGVCSSREFFVLKLELLIQGSRPSFSKFERYYSHKNAFASGHFDALIHLHLRGDKVALNSPKKKENGQGLTAAPWKSSATFQGLEASSKMKSWHRQNGSQYCSNSLGLRRRVMSLIGVMMSAKRESNNPQKKF